MIPSTLVEPDHELGHGEKVLVLFGKPVRLRHFDGHFLWANLLDLAEAISCNCYAHVLEYSIRAEPRFHTCILPNGHVLLAEHAIPEWLLSLPHDTAGGDGHAEFVQHLRDLDAMRRAVGDFFEHEFPKPYKRFEEAE